MQAYIPKSANSSPLLQYTDRKRSRVSLIGMRNDASVQGKDISTLYHVLFTLPNLGCPGAPARYITSSLRLYAAVGDGDTIVSKGSVFGFDPGIIPSPSRRATPPSTFKISACFSYTSHPTGSNNQLVNCTFHCRFIALPRRIELRKSFDIVHGTWFPRPARMR